MSNMKSSSRTQSSKAAFAALAASLAFSVPAMAQNAPMLPPAGMAAPTLPGAPGFNAPAAAEKPIALPQGATIGGSGEKVRDLATQAGRSLEELIGSAVSTRGEAEIGAMAERKRRVMMLEYQLEEAKLAKQLWVELNGEQEGNSEEIERLHAEKASLEAELVRVQATRLAPPPSDPDPVVAEVTGAAGSYRAKILIPYAGQVMATVGSTLPNGMKVTGISKDGVNVRGPSGNKVLTFGDSVPKTRPVKASPSAAASGMIPGSALQQIGN